MTALTFTETLSLKSSHPASASAVDDRPQIDAHELLDHRHRAGSDSALHTGAKRPSVKTTPRSHIRAISGWRSRRAARQAQGRTATAIGSNSGFSRTVILLHHACVSSLRPKVLLVSGVLDLQVNPSIPTTLARPSAWGSVARRHCSLCTSITAATALTQHQPCHPGAGPRPVRIPRRTGEAHRYQPGGDEGQKASPRSSNRH